MAEILLLGGSGRLGQALRKVLGDHVAPPRSECDLTDPASIERTLSRYHPTTVIHAAGWVDVRGCEMDRPRAWKMNVEGTQNLVHALRAHADVRLLYISTACVFRGDRGDYTEDDTPYPANFYGVTKLVGEQLARTLGRHMVVRTDFVARQPWPHPGAFVDRFSTSVFAEELAVELAKIAHSRETGLKHLCGLEKVSHYDLARITSPDVKPIELKDVDLPLPRDQSLRSVRGGEVLELRR